MKFDRQPATSSAKLPVKFQSDWSIFPNYIQLLNCENSVGNLLVAKRTTQGANMGCPFHLWVAFGDRAAIFGQLWHDSMKPVIVNAYSITSFGTTEFCQSYGSSWHSPLTSATFIHSLVLSLADSVEQRRPRRRGHAASIAPTKASFSRSENFAHFLLFCQWITEKNETGKQSQDIISFNRSNGKLRSSLKFLKQTSLEKLEIVRFHEFYRAIFEWE